MQREDFSGTELEIRPETAASAVAAREKAAVEARYIVALRRPRDMETVRVRLLRECDRPGFAEVARYKKPTGGKFIEGPSIRFAEAALRCLGNVYPEQSIVFEDDQQRIVRVTVTDLESNLSYASEILVKKTVERREPKEGQEIISERVNSVGKKVYLVYASDDEVQMKQNALVSKALRNSGLRLLPGDIQEECMDRVLATQRKKDKDDPDAAKRKLIDAFAAIGIEPADLQAYIGHSLDRVQPAELADLRSIYATLRDSETTWDAIMEARGVTGSAADARKVAEEKIARMTKATEAPGPYSPTAEEEMERATRAAAESEQGGPPPPNPPAEKLQFGRRK